MSVFYACKDEKSKITSIYIDHKEQLNWKYKDSCSITISNDQDSLLFSALGKYRGGFSSRYFKHSFSVKLERAYPLLGLPSDEDWVFNANYIDKTFQRHKLSYDLFRMMSPENKASRSAYFRLIQNQKAQGLYVLMEKINAQFLGLDLSDSLAMLFKDPPLFYLDTLAPLKERENYYEQKYPKFEDRRMDHKMQELKSFLFESSDSLFYSDISKHFDLESVIDWHLILLLSNNGDGIMKNFYLYKLNSREAFRFAIWDYDHSYGREGDYEYNMLSRELNCRRSILIDRLFRIPEFKYEEKLADRYHELRSMDVFSLSGIEQMMEENEKTLLPYLEENQTLWPDSSKWYHDQNDYYREVSLMREYFLLRFSQLDKRFGFN